jgi:hypothetical protein
MVARNGWISIWRRLEGGVYKTNGGLKALVQSPLVIQLVGRFSMFRLNLLERRDQDQQKRNQSHDRRDSSGREGINPVEYDSVRTERRDQSV